MQRVTVITVTHQTHDVRHAGVQRSPDRGTYQRAVLRVADKHHLLPLHIQFLFVIALGCILYPQTRIHRPVVLCQMLRGLPEVVQRVVTVHHRQTQVDGTVAQEAGYYPQLRRQVLLVLMASGGIAVGTVKDTQQRLPRRGQRSE